MSRQPEPTGEQLEAVYESMIGALARRDIGRLDSLLADEVEFRSYATGVLPCMARATSSRP